MVSRGMLFFFFYTLYFCTRFCLKNGICCKWKTRFQNYLTKCPLSHDVELQSLWFSSHHVINSFAKIYTKYISRVAKEFDNFMRVLAMMILIGNRQCKKEWKLSLHMLLMIWYKNFTLVSFHSRCLNFSETALDEKYIDFFHSRNQWRKRMTSLMLIKNH